jgi:lipopolysaccharide transport system ATP-binding protein
MMISEDQTSPLLTAEQAESDVVLSVRGISKKFCRSLRRSLFYGIQDIAGELTGSRRQNTKLRPHEFWALDDVNFDLHRGEAIGLVGVNGSGKTTLLRIISGLIRPDKGAIRVKGQVAPLIALGAGFSPVLTGRENVYANMSILGLSKKQIDDRFEEVVDFAELWDAIDTPVQNYSSGMAARLGFSCAVHTDPNILLIDEVLAVGDIKFRSKCERKLHGLLEKGTSFVLVSHYAQSLLNICTSAVYLSRGKITLSGDPREVLERYEEDLFTTTQPTGIAGSPAGGNLHLSHTTRHLEAEITGFHFETLEGKTIESPVTGEPVQLCVEFQSAIEIQNACIFIAIYRFGEDETLALHLNGYLDSQLNESTFKVSPGKHQIKAKLPYLGLRPGSYTMKVFLKDGTLYTLDGVDGLRFRVEKQESLNRGGYYQHRHWELVSQSSSQVRGGQDGQNPNHDLSIPG